MFMAITRTAGWNNITGGMIASFREWHYMILFQSFWLDAAIGTAEFEGGFDFAPLGGS